MHLHVAARLKFTRWIVDVDLREQCARRVVDSSGVPNDEPLEVAAWEFGQSQLRFQSGLDMRRIYLRDIHVDSQPVDRRDVKQFARGTAAAAGIDQSSNIGVACSDHTVERSVNFLE